MDYTQYTQKVNELKAHGYHYFVENAPVISDAEYDKLYFAAQDYEINHPDEVLPDSPTQYAYGEAKNGHIQVRRRVPMLSTEKAQTKEAVDKWMQRVWKRVYLSEVAIEWKFDGISCSLVYLDGQLVEASYGKGIEGNDCLAVARNVVPNRIPLSDRVEVRGEMVVPFDRLAETGYKNCRSAAAGILADTHTCMSRCLEFHPYWTDAYNLANQSQAMKLLYPLGFDRTESCVVYSRDELHEALGVLEAQRSDLPFPVDGVVVKLNDRCMWNSMGGTAHHPNYLIAYKFAAATQTTTLRRIEVTVGGTGKRTPVAYFDPIVINGATYSKASMGSEATLASLGIQPGDSIIVSLRNDVIPHVEGKAK